METHYIVVGTGELAVNVARLLKVKIGKVQVIECRYHHQSSVGSLCENEGLPYKGLRAEEITEELLALLKDHTVKVVSAINTYIFPEEVVDHPNFRGINYHNALLPHHRGMNVESHIIFSGDKITGITWHEITARIDEGRIICQRTLELDDDMTSIQLLKQQSDLAFEAFLSFVDDFIKDDLTLTPQATGGEYHPITSAPHEGKLTLDMTDEEICRFLRAMNYGILAPFGWPCLLYEGQQLPYRRYSIQPKDESKCFFHQVGKEIRFKVVDGGHIFVLKLF